MKEAHVRKKFKGKLAIPMEPRKLGLFSYDRERQFHLTDEKDIEVRQKEWLREDIENVDSLCEHYGLEKGQFFRLCIELARELKIPAFKEEPKRRAKKWDDHAGGVLVVEVNRLIDPNNQSHGVVWACQELAKREPWKSFLEEKDGDNTSPNPGEALRRVYYNFKDRKFTKVLHKAYLYHENNNDRSGWDSMVEDVKKSLQ